MGSKETHHARNRPLDHALTDHGHSQLVCSQSHRVSAAGTPKARRACRCPGSRTTSRTDEHSGIRLYRVPASPRLRTVLDFPDQNLGDIEIEWTPDEAVGPRVGAGRAGDAFAIDDYEG